MRKVFIAIITAFSLSAFISSADNKTFKKLYPLVGSWKMITKRGAVCEEWKKVSKNRLQSKGYFIRGKDTIISESIALTNSKEGVFYTSTVEDQNNKQPIAFKMTGSENNTFVFENPQHDFPKRIVYRFITTDSLHAYIDDGTETGKKQNFYYKRQ